MRRQLTLLSSEDLVHLLSPQLDFKSLCALLATAHALYRVSGVAVDLSLCDSKARTVKASWALEFIRRLGHRFMVVGVATSHCTQGEFDELLASPGLNNFSCQGSSSNITSLAGLCRAPTLLRLRLTDRAARGLTDVSPLACCLRLETLNLYGPPNGQQLGHDQLAALALTWLDLRRCGDEAVRGMRTWADPSRSAAAWSLTSLNMQGTPLTDADVAALSGLGRLKELDLSLCKRLSSTQPLAGCASLATLTLTGCLALVDVNGLADCSLLESLYLTGCTALCDVSPLEGCPALRMLNVGHCTKLVDASALGHCASLETLNLRCSGVNIVPCRPGLRILFA